jgi:hypothetical protein
MMEGWNVGKMGNKEKLRVAGYGLKDKNCYELRVKRQEPFRVAG